MFYLYGGLGLVWTVAWIFFGADCPSKHGRMSQEERKYVENGPSTEEKEVKVILAKYYVREQIVVDGAHTMEGYLHFFTVYSYTGRSLR